MMRYLLLCLVTIFAFEQFAVAQVRANGVFTDVRDGRRYGWIKIDNQVWMSENLAYLPQVNKVDDSKFEGECFYVYGYNDDVVSKAKASANYLSFGVLYNWEAANKSCPTGWHLPTEIEWKTLEQNLGMSKAEVGRRDWRNGGNVGKKLKSTIGWVTNTGTDEIGFKALPAGCRGYEGFASMGYCTYFWTATVASGDNAWRRGLCGDDGGNNRVDERKYFGLSVRCVRD